METKDYLSAIRDAKLTKRTASIDFASLPDEIDKDAVAAELASGLPDEYKKAIASGATDLREIELNFLKIPIRPSLLERGTEALAKTGGAIAGEIKHGTELAEKLPEVAIETARIVSPSIKSAIQQTKEGLIKPVASALTMPGRGFAGIGVGAESLALGKPPAEAIHRAAEATKPGFVPAKGENFGAFVGKMFGDWPLFAASVAAGVPMAPSGRFAKAAYDAGLGTGLLQALDEMAASGEISPGDVAIATAGGALVGVGVEGSLPTIKRLIGPVKKRIQTELNTAIYWIKRGLGAKVESGLVPYDFKRAVAEGRMGFADAIRESEELFQAELAKRGLTPEPPPTARPAETITLSAAEGIKPTEMTAPPEGLLPTKPQPSPTRTPAGNGIPAEAPIEMPKQEPTATKGPEPAPTPTQELPPTPIPEPKPPEFVPPPDIQIGDIFKAKNEPFYTRVFAFRQNGEVILERGNFSDGKFFPFVTNVNLGTTDTVFASQDSIREGFDKLLPNGTFPGERKIEPSPTEEAPSAAKPIEPITAKIETVGPKTLVEGLDLKTVRKFRNKWLVDLETLAQGVPATPEETIKFRKEGLFGEDGKPTPALLSAVKVIDTVNSRIGINRTELIETDKFTTKNILKKLAKERPALILTAKEGWITDGRMAYTITEEDKILANEYLKQAKEGNAPNMELILKARREAKDEIVSLVGGKQGRDISPFALETESGQRIFANGGYYKFLKEKFPKSKWFSSGPEKPIFIVSGKKTDAVFMPLSEKTAFDVYDLATGTVIPPRPKPPLTVNLGGSEGASIGGFAEGTPVELGGIQHIKAFQMPEIVKLAYELMGQYPQISRRMGVNTRGFFKPIGDGFIRLRPELFQDTEQAAKTLAHEVGHLTDWLPEKDLKRGNLLGRLLSVRGFLKETFGSISVTNSELRDELYALSKYWRPFDEATASRSFLAYRKSGKELYADAVSVLLNSPGTLERMAPKFYKGFFENLDKKPKVKVEFFKLQELMNGSEENLVMARRAERLADSARGEEIFDHLNARKDVKNARMFERVRMEYEDKYAPIYTKYEELKSKNILLPDEENPHYFLQQHDFSDNKIYLMLSEMDNKVVSVLDSIEVSWADFGDYLFLNRVMHDRQSFANSKGTTKETAAADIELRKKQLGPERFAKLEMAARAFHDIAYPVFVEGVNVGSIAKGVLPEIEKNKYTYATFANLDALEETGRISATVKGQKGSFGAVANTATATVMKLMALNRLNSNQIAKNKFVALWQKEFAGEIAPSKEIKSGTISVFKDTPGWGRLERLENGKLKSYDVDPYIAESFKHVKPGEAGIALDILHDFQYGWLHPLYVTYNLGFQTKNLPKDFFRTWKNTPGATVLGLLLDYGRGFKESVRHVAGWGESEIIKELIESGSMDAKLTSLTADTMDDQLGRAFKRMGMREDTESNYHKLRNSAFHPIATALRGLEFITSTEEVLGKVAAYRTAKRLGMKGEELAFHVRNYGGTPNFKVHGTKVQTTNTLFMYSKIAINGMVADAQIMTQPKTRGGFWWKTIMSTILPKLFMRLAIAGVLGKELKDHYERMTEYDLSNYITIPLGKILGSMGRWLSLYARIPQDRTGQLISGLFWKLSSYATKRPEYWRNILSYGAGILPSVSPPLTMAVNWGLFLTGKDPYDFYRGRPIVPESAFKAGTWPGMKAMAQWTFNEFGMSQFAHYDDSKKTTTEIVLQVAPIINSLVKASDYGLKEHIKQDIEEDEAERAVHRIGRVREYKEFLRDRFFLQKQKQAGAIAHEEEQRLRKMNLLYNHKLKKLDQAVLKAEQSGQIIRARNLQNTIKRILDRESGQEEPQESQ